MTKQAVFPLCIHIYIFFFFILKGAVIPVCFPSPSSGRGGGCLVGDVGRKYRSLCMLIGELGVVARYLRSVGAALHSPTWLPTGRLRATFLTPQSFFKQRIWAIN